MCLGQVPKKISAAEDDQPHVFIIAYVKQRRVSRGPTKEPSHAFIGAAGDRRLAVFDSAHHLHRRDEPIKMSMNCQRFMEPLADIESRAVSCLRTRTVARGLPGSLRLRGNCRYGRCLRQRRC
jgi:hypothetical protein